MNENLDNRHFYHDHSDSGLDMSRAIVFINGIVLTSTALYWSCASNQSSSGRRPNSVAVEAVGGGRGQTQKLLYKRVKNAVYEVIVPRATDLATVYAKPLPLERLPYHQRVDKFDSIGTAFAIGPNRFVSAAHVFRLEHFSLNNKFFIRDINGKTFEVSHVMSYSNHRDLIEFQVTQPPAKRPFLRIASQMEIGDDVFSVGNALGEGISIRGGQIASFTPEEVKGAWKFIRFTAPASPGNSGGPLINIKGEVTGVILRRTENENLNYAIPIQELKRLGNKLELYEQVKDEAGQTKDWSFSSALPMPLPRLIQLSLTEIEKKGQTHIVGRIKSMTESAQKEAYWQHGLRHPVFGQNLSEFDFSFERKAASYSKRKYVEVKSKRGNRIEWGRQEEKKDKNSSLQIHDEHFLLAVPQNPSQAFLDPQFALEEFLQSVGWSISFAGESISVLSYGKPHEVKVFRDPLGRDWKRARWRSALQKRNLDLFCHAVPRGAMCRLNSYPTLMEKIGLAEIMEWSARFAMVSYSGSIKEWQNFLKSRQVPVPEFFKSAQVVEEGSMISVVMSDFTSQYGPIKTTEPLRALTVSVALSPQSNTKLDVQHVTFHSKDDFVASVMRQYAPDSQCDESHHEDWKKLQVGAHPFNSTPRKQSDINVITGALQPIGSSRKPAARVSNDKDSLFYRLCTAGEDTDLAKRCEGLRFVRQK